MNKYEIMYIVKATLSEDEIKAVKERFEGILTKNDAKIIDSKKLGQKELAYEVKKQKTGYYFLVTIESKDDKAINEFDRLALISKDVLRHLVTKLEN